MTLSTTGRVKRYSGNDSTTIFAYDFRILDEDHLVVILTGAAGTDTTLTITTHYTVSGVGDAGGGNVTMITAPATGETLTIYRLVPQTQNTDIQNQGPFAAQTFEDAFDKLTMAVQDVQNDADRAVKVDITDTTDPDSLLASISASEVAAAASAASAATEVTYAAEWANKAEDSLVSAAAGGDEVDDYSALHFSKKAEDEVANAATEVTYAAEWANKAEDSLVSAAAGGDQVDDYSALHHANKAAASAVVAQAAASSVNSDTHLVNQTNYTVLDADGYLTLLVNTGTSTRTITLPTVADNDERQIVVKKIDSGSGDVTIDGEGAETIDGSATLTIDAQYEAFRLQSDGSEWHLVSTYAEAADATPSGALMAFARATAPTGWLACDGSAVSRTTYAALWTAIGTNYGYGDGSTTFNLPDLRGKFARGVDSAAGNDPDAAGRTAQATGGNTGDNVGSIQADEFKSHTHGGSVISGSGAFANTPSSYSFIPMPSVGGNETRPINVNVLYCVKT